MQPLAHVLWIGGAPCSGKTSIARAIATANDIRVYHADAHAWEHHDRALRQRLPASELWEGMTPDERWVTTPRERMADHSIELNADRFRLILEDIRALPASPLIVVEGTPLLPWLVEDVLASRAHAVWLLPTPAIERERLSERPTTTWDETSDAPRARENRILRELLIAEAIERGAATHGLATLRIDGRRDLRSAQAAVENLFRPVLESGPRAQTVAERRALRRSENDQIQQQLHEYLRRVPAAGTPETCTYAFACECGRSGCDKQIPATIGEYDFILRNGRFLTTSPSRRKARQRH